MAPPQTSPFVQIPEEGHPALPHWEIVEESHVIWGLLQVLESRILDHHLRMVFCGNNDDDDDDADISNPGSMC